MTSTIVKDSAGLKDRVQALPGSAKAGLILSALGFLVRFPIEQEKFVSGVPSCSGFDFGAWIIGLITIVTALVTMVEARRAESRMLVLVLGFVILGFGVFHLLTAYQVFLPIC